MPAGGALVAPATTICTEEVEAWFWAFRPATAMALVPDSTGTEMDHGETAASVPFAPFKRLLHARMPVTAALLVP